MRRYKTYDTVEEFKAHIKERQILASKIRAERIKNNGGKISKTDRQELLEAAGYKCQKCGTTENLQVDHVIPIKLGGINSKENAQILCLRCNIVKGGFDTTDYR